MDEPQAGTRRRRPEKNPVRNFLIKAEIYAISLNMRRIDRVVATLGGERRRRKQAWTARG